MKEGPRKYRDSRYLEVPRAQWSDPRKVLALDPPDWHCEARAGGMPDRFQVASAALCSEEA